MKITCDFFKFVDYYTRKNEIGILVEPIIKIKDSFFIPEDLLSERDEMDIAAICCANDSITCSLINTFPNKLQDIIYVGANWMDREKSEPYDIVYWELFHDSKEIDRFIENMINA
ncbi:hypothetical protein JW935_09360 [candidate division KSB1 bacterium]|nr:hypothetical protein [candidate division KSB1 bacterium]